MTITKLGHCCLIIEVGGVRILTDPGGWTTAQNEVKDIDVVLITHEHADHFHLESLQTVLKNNPRAKVFTNQGVAKFLQPAGIEYQLLEHNQLATIEGVPIEGHGKKHADIYPTIPAVINTGYFIASQFFYPGDVFYNPSKPVKILALPVAGPWMKMAEALDYAKLIKPLHCFPVHDGMLKIPGPFHMLPEKILTPLGITFQVPAEGQPMEFD